MSATDDHVGDVSGDDEGEPTSQGRETVAAAEGSAYAQELQALHDIAIAAEELARLIEADGEDVLARDGLMTVEQARSNAAAIVSSLDRVDQLLGVAEQDG